MKMLSYALLLSSLLLSHFSYACDDSKLMQEPVSPTRVIHTADIPAPLYDIPTSSTFTTHTSVPSQTPPSTPVTAAYPSIVFLTFLAALHLYQPVNLPVVQNQNPEPRFQNRGNTHERKFNNNPKKSFQYRGRQKKVGNQKFSRHGR